jgi:hypothetical protein
LVVAVLGERVAVEEFKVAPGEPVVGRPRKLDVAVDCIPIGIVVRFPDPTQLPVPSPATRALTSCPVLAFVAFEFTPRHCRKDRHMSVHLKLAGISVVAVSLIAAGLVLGDKNLALSTSGPPSHWTAPAALNANAPAPGSVPSGRPQIATDNAGNWVAVWQSDDDIGGTIGTDWDILVARSDDNGVTWTDAAPLNPNAHTDSGDDVRPHVATSGAGTWVAVWQSAEQFGGTLGSGINILFARSTDNGATWSGPEPPALEREEERRAR